MLDIQRKNAFLHFLSDLSDLSDEEKVIPVSIETIVNDPTSRSIIFIEKQKARLLCEFLLEENSINEHSFHKEFGTLLNMNLNLIGFIGCPVDVPIKESQSTVPVPIAIKKLLESNDITKSIKEYVVVIVQINDITYSLIQIQGQVTCYVGKKPISLENHNAKLLSDLYLLHKKQNIQIITKPYTFLLPHPLPSTQKDMLLYFSTTLSERKIYTLSNYPTIISLMRDVSPYPDTEIQTLNILPTQVVRHVLMHEIMPHYQSPSYASSLYSYFSQSFSYMPSLPDISKILEDSGILISNIPDAVGSALHSLSPQGNTLSSFFDYITNTELSNSTMQKKHSTHDNEDYLLITCQDDQPISINSVPLYDVQTTEDGYELITPHISLVPQGEVDTNLVSPKINTKEIDQLSRT